MEKEREKREGEGLDRTQRESEKKRESFFISKDFNHFVHKSGHLKHSDSGSNDKVQIHCYT